MLAPDPCFVHAALFTNPMVNTNHPIQNFLASAVALTLAHRTLAADQCPLVLLSGLIAPLLFGLELVSSSPCVIFSMKLM